MVNFGSLMAKIVSGVWGTPPNFSGFRVLFSLLYRRRTTEIIKSLHDVRPSPGLVHYMYTFSRAIDPNGFLPDAKFTLRPSLAFYFGSVTAGHSSCGRQPNFATWYTRNCMTELSLLVIFNRGRHLYSKGSHHVGHRPTF